MLASIRRRKKLLEKISIQGKVVTELSHIKKPIVQHFKELYTKQPATQFDITNLRLPRLTRNQSQKLVQEITMDEIKEAFLSCDPTRAPGHDGFNLKCIKHVWPVIGDEFSKCVL